MAKKEAPLQTFFVCSLCTVAWQLLLSVYAVLQGHPQRQPEQHSVQAAGCRHYGGAAAAAGSSLRSTHVRRGSAGATDKNGFLLFLLSPCLSRACLGKPSFFIATKAQLAYQSGFCSGHTVKISSSSRTRRLAVQLQRGRQRLSSSSVPAPPSARRSSSSSGMSTRSQS